MESEDELKAVAVMTEIRRIKLRISSLEVDLIETKKVLGKRIASLQEECPHPSLTFVPDASGNNDSYEYCNYCSKEM